MEQNRNHVKIIKTIEIKSINSTIALVNTIKKSKVMTPMGYHPLQKSLTYIPNYRIISLKEFQSLFKSKDFNQELIALKHTYWISDHLDRISMARCTRLLDYNNTISSYELYTKEKNKMAFAILIKDS